MRSGSHFKVVHSAQWFTVHPPPRTRFFQEKPPLVVPMMVPEAPELNESLYMSPPTAQAVVPLATATLRRV